MVFIKNVRLQNYDYRSDGYYFVTVVADARRAHFEGKEEEVAVELKDLAMNIPGLRVDYFVVMSNHVHVIFIFENCQMPLGEIVRRFKAKVSRRLGDNTWQPNYYEHVIRNEKALDKIREYVVNNPEKHLLKFDQFYI